jgi:hypothetical protein
LAPVLDAFNQEFESQGFTTDWDDGAGEDWAQVFSMGAFVAMIWRRGPLVIALDRLLASLITWFKQNDLDVLLVPSFEEPLCRLSRSAVSIVLPGTTWPESDVSLDGMSILDLWWTTV